MKYLRFILAVFRLTMLVRYDDFPPIYWLREEWSIFHPRWREFLRCCHCLSIHAAWIILLMNHFRLLKWIIDVLAFSGATIIFHDLIWVKRKR